MATGETRSAGLTPASVSDLADLVPSWRLSLEAENKSPRTIAGFTDATTQLAAFLQSRGMPTDVGAIAREHVEAFLVHLRDTRSASTPETRYRGLKRFFAWLEEEGEITRSPIYRMRPPKVSEQPVDVPSSEALQALLAVCTTNDYDGRRDTAIVRLREGRQAGTRAMRLPAGHRRPVKDGAATRSISSSQGRADPRSGSSRSLRCDESERQEPQHDQSRECVRDIARSRHAATRSRKTSCADGPNCWGGSSSRRWPGSSDRR